METEGIRKHHEGTKVYHERFHGETQSHMNTPKCGGWSS